MTFRIAVIPRAHDLSTAGPCSPDAGGWRNITSRLNAVLFRDTLWVPAADLKSYIPLVEYVRS
jgi:hypothetical protein